MNNKVNIITDIYNSKGVKEFMFGELNDKNIEITYTYAKNNIFTFNDLYWAITRLYDEGIHPDAIAKYLKLSGYVYREFYKHMSNGKYSYPDVEVFRITTGLSHVEFIAEYDILNIELHNRILFCINKLWERFGENYALVFIDKFFGYFMRPNTAVGKMHNKSPERIRQILARSSRYFKAPTIKNIILNGKIEYNVKHVMQTHYDVYDINIAELDLSVRAYNALKRANITTLGKIKQVLDNGGLDALKRVRNIGEKTANNILEVYTKFVSEFKPMEYVQNVKVTRDVDFNDPNTQSIIQHISTVIKERADMGTYT